MADRKSYRLRTGVGNDAPDSLNVNLTQTYDTVDVLSLELNQKNFYKMPAAGYGVIVGRVIANGGFGIPNAKVSVFIPYDSNSLFADGNFLYRFSSPMARDSEGIRYNLLPRKVDNECHQDVGTFYNKEYLLDNKDLIEVFEKYYKYTAVTNEAGDYFIYGVPVGSQTVHVDLDLSDIGVLSQRPRDMIYKGYNINQFESPNKFKKDKNLNTLAQIYSQDRVVNVYPFWGDTTVDPTNGTITRCDINIDYKFEPTCVFMGSIVSDTGNRAISQRCVPDDEIGKMSELIAGEGKIEMIRKTFDGKVEEFSIKGNNLIDGDGVWCYQIPMNLDYVMTDEFGNMVPTDNPDKGIATRARVRFRISMNETQTDETARKRARFLVPNNPKLVEEDYPDFYNSHEADYEFGTFTKEESYRDLFWNKVYTVKSYIPRLQKAKAMRRRVHTGIKNVNHAGANNPFPFNNLFVRLTFVYRFLCSIMSLFCLLIYWINTVLGFLAVPLYWLAKLNVKLDEIFFVQDNDGPLMRWLKGLLNPLHFLFSLLTDSPLVNHPLKYLAVLLLKAVENSNIKLDNFCDDGNTADKQYFLCEDGIGYKELFENPDRVIEIPEIDDYKFPSKPLEDYNTDLSLLFNCIENQLVQDQECTSFNFNNDWVNGVLYAPLWYRKIRTKKKIFFNLIPIPDKDKWCNGEKSSNDGWNRLSLCQTCAQRKTVIDNTLRIKPLKNVEVGSNLTYVNNEDTCYGYKCHKKTISFINVDKGLIIQKETMFGENVYYYKSVEYDNSSLISQETPKEYGDIKTLFATDIVLLGSLNACDSEGVPQFFKGLESTTYNMPPDLILMDYDSDEEKIKFEERAVSENTTKVMSDIGIGDGGLENVEDEIDESEAININTVHTDKTGADWGNYGKDQVKTPPTPNDYIFVSKNQKPDYGGLFYGLTCWSAYTKPKSCVNLSRICEYGVSLDETQEYPDYNSPRNSDGSYKYETMAPDGFISYDELYDKDGRAMFATMNGNNLRTKINPKNGFPVYDFVYLYPENFDGTLWSLMQIQGQNPMPSPQSSNYEVEQSSEAYMRFRYGRYAEDNPVVKFYKSTIKLEGLYNGVNADNVTRFPKFENSFYFYFGLKPGSTAIDKFRTLYYSECKDTDVEHAVVTVDYTPSEWCSEILPNGKYTPGNGWISVDATYLDIPYSLKLTSMSGEPLYYGEHDEEVYSIEIDDIDKPKVIITKNQSYVPQNLLDNGFEVLVDEGNNTYGILNGTVRITLVDANGEEYSQVLNFTPPYISATIDRKAFRYKNDELKEAVENIVGHEVSDLYLEVAQLGGEEGQNMGMREIGGFIQVTDVSQNGNRLIDFKIEIEPLFDIQNLKRERIMSGSQALVASQVTNRDVVLATGYNGTDFELHQKSNTSQIPLHIINNYTLMVENGVMVNNPPIYCPYTYDYPQYPLVYDAQNPNNHQTNGGRYDLRFGVPVGGEKYRVIVTMLCKRNVGMQTVYYESRNRIVSDILVPEPIDFKMLINGIDYDLIKHFDTGWRANYPFPDNYLPMDASDMETVHGWLDMKNIDGLKSLDYLTTLQPYGGDIETTDLLLSYTRFNMPEAVPVGFHITSYYDWNEAYSFNASQEATGIGTFEEIPDTLQSTDVTLILVLDSVSGKYYYYEWNENGNPPQYVPLHGFNVETISMEDYFNHCSLEMRNSIISKFNYYISLRQSFVENVYQAFSMIKDINDTTFTIKVNNETYELPVKTLIYNSPDYINGTTTEFLPVDSNMNIKECNGITVGTLTSEVILPQSGEYVYNTNYSNPLLSDIGVPRFQSIDDENYKKPWLVAIENALQETLPYGLGELTIPLSYSQADEMFGVHVIDKRLSLVYNSWACMENWPMYKAVETDEKYYTLPGLVAGFVLNGEPDSYGDNGETYFTAQDVNGENFNIETLNVNPDTGLVDETRVPVVRVLYRDNVDQSFYYNYTINQNNNSPIIPGEYQPGDTGIFHMLLPTLNTSLHIIDKNGGHNFFFNDVVEPISVEYERTDNSQTYRVKVAFEEGYYYVFYLNEENPVYNKMLPSNNNNGVLVFPEYSGNMPSMQFWCNTFPLTTSHEQTWELGCDYVDTLYVVRMSKDKQRRAISKTFDLTLVEYNLYGQVSGGSMSSNNCIRMRINLGLDEVYYYMKFYDFTVQFIEGENVILEKTFEGYNNYNSSGPLVPYKALQSNNIYYINVIVNMMRYETQNDINTTLEQLKSCDAYLIDVTGVRHKMRYVEGEFEHEYKRRPQR